MLCKNSHRTLIHTPTRAHTHTCIRLDERKTYFTLAQFLRPISYYCFCCICTFQIVVYFVVVVVVMFLPSFFSPLALFMVSLLHNTNKREQQIEKPFGPQSFGKYFCWRMIDARRCSRSKKHCPKNRMRGRERERAHCTSVECPLPVDG